MNEAVYAPDPLNEQASVLVDAQTDIKTAIKQGVLSGASVAAVKESVRKIIVRALARIRSPTLKADARISLMRFASEAYGRFTERLKTIPSSLLPAVVVLMAAITASQKEDGVYIPKTEKEKRAAVQIASAGGFAYRSGQAGIPLQEFSQRYMKRVSEALSGLARENALDPNDMRGKNSLRNLAEMQVRYERHQEEIETFRKKGTKLVVCSVHADCSDRCARWQGLVYSLDGTEGYTADGRKYQPLENATDIYYTAKSTGRTWKNGLLGFNCRHKLYEYRAGMGIPTVSAEERKREYAVTQRQRELERRVILCREEALIDKDTNVSEYRKWRVRAQEAYAQYKRFSMENGRAYYPDRVKIL